MTTAITRPTRMRLDTFARASGLHPELVTRLVRLGLLDATRGAHGELLFAPSDLRRAARVQRLHSELSLNYAALGLVLDLLDRIDVLETALRHRPGSQGGTTRSWI